MTTKFHYMFHSTRRCESADLSLASFFCLLHVLEIKFLRPCPKSPMSLRKPKPSFDKTEVFARRRICTPSNVLRTGRETHQRGWECSCGHMGRFVHRSRVFSAPCRKDRIGVHGSLCVCVRMGPLCEVCRPRRKRRRCGLNGLSVRLGRFVHRSCAPAGTVCKSRSRACIRVGSALAV